MSGVPDYGNREETDGFYAANIQGIDKTTAIEMQLDEAADLLCDLLFMLGYKKTVTAYEEVLKRFLDKLE